ncbi:hypothetical protein C0J50_9477 [Silurus asotus]|uniref:Integrase catalytic domain-containing protein n=1 Tax=Silurus asotus TaxID=30991 RepID=A0AAD5A463_SILAS|nr:hypothetical protein C0J50_9477 [Silurus asotus]
MMVVIGDNIKAPFLVDTGATYSSIGKEGSKLPLTSKAIKAVGISGKTQTLRFTEPQWITIAGISVQTPLLYSPATPVNLLGRDALCKLGAKIHCGPTGVWVTLPDALSSRYPMLWREQEEDYQKLDKVYWLEIWKKKKSNLWKTLSEWRPWLQLMRPDCHDARDPIHCTIKYDEGEQDEEYNKLWDQTQEGQMYGLRTKSIIVGPEEVAAEVDLPEEVKDWYQVEKAAPHITLMIGRNFESKDLGPMVRQAQEVKRWNQTHNSKVVVSGTGKYLKIREEGTEQVVATQVLISPKTKRQGKAEVEVQMTLVVGEQELTEQEKEIALKEIPEQLWTKHATDVGLVKPSGQVKIQVKPDVSLPYQRQYPLSQQAIEGIGPTIKGLVEAGVLIPTQNHCNTPIFPVRKPNSDKWRLVHDLSPVNQVVIAETPVVPDPHTLLSNIPEETKEQCLKDSIIVLKALAKNGHKVSKEKLQFCSKKVEYLGRVLEGTTRKISPAHVEAIRNAPRPENVRQMLSFLGMAGFSRPWICDFALKAQPLRDMIKAAGQNKPSAKLTWTPDGITAFELIKNTMASAPALACPNYSKPFHLYVSERQGFASAVLMQHQEGMGNQPIAYFSTALDTVEKGMPPCYRAISAAAFAYQKASSITMGHPVTLYTSHALFALLTSQKFVITNARRTGYDVILSSPELTIERCNTVNPAERMVLPNDGTPHCCTEESEKFLKARADLEPELLEESQRVFFVDGSCYRTLGGNKAGYAVVEYDSKTQEYKTIAQAQVPQPCSAQLAEIKALTAASPISHIPVPMGPFRHLVMDFVDMQDRVSGKRYILVVIDRFSRWVKAVATADNKAKTVIKFLCREVIPRFGIPDQVQSDNGPHFANVLMKELWKALGVKHKLGCVYHPQSQGMVERANGTIKAKVAKICESTKLNWVQALPLALMKMRSQTNRTLHLTSHEIVTGRPMPMPFTRGPYKGPELEQLEKEMSSYVKHLTKIHRTVYPQVCVATKASEGPTDKEAKKLAKVVPGDFVYIKTFKKKHWKTPRREGPFKVVLATPTTLKVEGKEHWYHLNHCCRAYVDGEKGQKPNTSGQDSASDSEDSSDGDDHGPSTSTGPARRTRAQEKKRAERLAKKQTTPDSQTGDSSLAQQPNLQVLLETPHTPDPSAADPETPLADSLSTECVPVATTPPTSDVYLPVLFSPSDFLPLDLPDPLQYTDGPSTSSVDPISPFALSNLPPLYDTLDPQDIAWEHQYD